MAKYKHIYLFMLAPMILMQAGIFFDYWGDLLENDWAIHVHYWLATFWYFFLIVQPWLFAKDNMAAHRTIGIIGFLIAGGVGFGALGMMHRDMMLVELATTEPERFGPFKPWFFYGIAVVEIVLISAFLFAVVQAIIHRKRLEDHSWWLISTVFILMMPALGRGFLVLWFMTQGFKPEISVMPPIYAALAVIIALVLVSAAWFNTLRHPATWLAVGVNVFAAFLEPLGRWETLQGILAATLTG